MPAEKHRLILDTNLWISFLLTSNYARLDRLLADAHASLLFSQELFSEFITVANRPKFKKYFSPADLQALLFAVRPKAEIIEVTSLVSLCRDPKDNFLLALALDGNATHLLTGDQDLLVLEKVGVTQIITLTEYITAL
ncbi:putative toxin-antitoxin system toxin component, PIN family [Hymenobacter baengnokdamensis]|uniref:putative toxin-antitoxin system toxin component, PIN family n=1 Tax=Hymenobacter baengnokdamensis TaxID=2615203 RepID=UPI0012477CDB|nr:putative toxin-antitoxin system toxin component, PIN family [Hymenobacter baengnokdamensis]